MLRQSMTREIITAVSATGKSETLKFKDTTGSRREAARPVRAFLNQTVGQMLFGMTRDGNVGGQ